MEKRSRKSLTLIIVGLIFIVVVVVVFLIVGHKSSNNPASLSQAQTKSAKQQIEKNWKLFFASSTSLQERENLLQNGSKFTQPIQSEFSSLGTVSSSVNVNSVSLV